MTPRRTVSWNRTLLNSLRYKFNIAGIARGRDGTERCDIPKHLLIGQYVPGTVAPKPHRCPNRKLVSDGRHGPSPTIILLLNDESAHPALPTTTCHPSNIDASILEMVESPYRGARPPLVAGKQVGEGGRFLYWRATTSMGILCHQEGLTLPDPHNLGVARQKSCCSNYTHRRSFYILRISHVVCRTNHVACRTPHLP